MFGTLVAVEALWRLSCDLLLVNEDLQLRSLCLCLHSRQFLTATQHTEGNMEETGIFRMSEVFKMKSEKAQRNQKPSKGKCFSPCLQDEKQITERLNIFQESCSVFSFENLCLLYNIMNFEILVAV